MKHSVTLEPDMRKMFGSNSNRKKGTKSLRKMYHRINRRKLKEDPEFDVVLFKKRIDYEF